jgi:hypothetical protein
MESTAQK